MTGRSRRPSCTPQRRVSTGSSCRSPTGSTTRFSTPRGPQLRVVANVGVGYDNVDVAACTARGVVVTNTPGVLTDATADLAFALVLMATRRLGEAERFVRSRRPWAFGLDFMVGSGITGKTLGIVGLGQIGAAVARRARAAGMEIAYAGRHRAAPELETELGARFLTLDELLAVSGRRLAARTADRRDARADRRRRARPDEADGVPREHLPRRSGR